MYGTGTFRSDTVLRDSNYTTTSGRLERSICFRRGPGLCYASRSFIRYDIRFRVNHTMRGKARFWVVGYFETRILMRPANETASQVPSIPGVM